MGRGRALANVGGAPARIVVPDLSGMILAAALGRATEIGFTLAVEDPPLAIEALASSGRWVVAHQEPPGGSTRYAGDTVVVVLSDSGPGGEAGDREPRNPLPRSLSDRAPLPEELGVPLEQTPRVASVHRLDEVRARFAGADRVDRSDR